MSDPDIHAGTPGKLAWKFLRTALLAYALACLLAACASTKLIYHPVVRTTEEVAMNGQAEGMVRWTDGSGRQIGMKRLADGGDADGIVLILHGNGGNATACAWYATLIQRHAKFDCYALEYPGYEDRPGEPSRTSLLNAAQEALASIDEKKPIYIVGESLGSGVATFLAGERPGRVAGLMLLSPFQSLGDVAQAHFPWLPARWLIRDNDFTSAEYLRLYRGPVGVLIDGQDEVVPPGCGRALYDGYAGPKRLWENPQGHHLQPDRSHDEFWGSVVEFWQTELKSPKK